MRRMWEIKNQTETTLDLYIYGEVKGDSYDWWNDEVIESETSANAFRDALASAGDVRTINLYINSEGGSVFEGSAIYSQLMRSKARKVVHVDGFACSIAAEIAMVGDEVIMAPNALMMIHNAWSYVVGNSAELRKAADDLDVINSAQRGAYLKKAGDKLSEDELVRMMDAETWLNAEDCVKYGLADKIGETAADIPNAGETVARMTNSLQSRIAACRSVAAQLRQLVTSPPPAKTPEPMPEPEPEPQSKEPDAPGIMSMLAGLNN